MNFSFKYSGEPGNVSATVSEIGGGEIDSIVGLKDEKAAQKWAAGVAALHKQACDVDRTSSHKVTIQGDGKFAL